MAFDTVPSQPTGGPCINPSESESVPTSAPGRGRPFGSKWNRLMLESIEAKPAADIILVVDESTSMTDVHRWLPQFVELLESELKKNMVGNGQLQNKYGLIGFPGTRFGFRGNPIRLSANGYMGSWQEFVKGASQLHDDGILEDGYDALFRAFDSRMYQWRKNVGKLVILITDEDRDQFNYALTRQRIYDLFKQSEVILTAVVNMRIYVKGQQVLGVSPLYSFSATSNGNVGVTRLDASPIYLPRRSSGNTKYDYSDLALMTGGNTWDVNELQLDEKNRQLFTQVIVKVSVPLTQVIVSVLFTKVVVYCLAKFSAPVHLTSKCRRVHLLCNIRNSPAGKAAAKL